MMNETKNNSDNQVFLKILLVLSWIFIVFALVVTLFVERISNNGLTAGLIAGMTAISVIFLVPVFGFLLWESKQQKSGKFKRETKKPTGLKKRLYRDGDISAFD
jgi:Na+/proline symporter